jgi:hypothetical protein
MSQFTQLGRPKEFKTTTPSVTITDVLEATLKRSSEQNKHYGNKRFPRITIGNDNSELTIKTSDVAALQNFFDGLEVLQVEVDYLGTDSTNDIDGVTTTNAGTYKYTCTVMRVEGAVEVQPAADGKPAEFTIKLIPSVKESDGSMPVQDITVTPGS